MLMNTQSSMIAVGFLQLNTGLYFMSSQDTVDTFNVYEIRCYMGIIFSSFSTINCITFPIENSLECTKTVSLVLLDKIVIVACSWQYLLDPE